MKRFELAIIVVLEFILFFIARWKFDEEYIWFAVLAFLLMNINSFHVWFLVCKGK